MKQRIIKWIKSLAREEMNSTLNPNGSNVSGLDDTYLFDFKNYGSGYSLASDGNGFFGNQIVVPTMWTNASADNAAIPATEDSIGNENKANIPKIKLKPIDVLVELETVPTPFSLTNLEDRIFVLKDKEKLITQKYAKREMGHLIERIENRRKYAEHKVFFDSFQNTTDEKIDILLKNHNHLIMKTSDIFIPEFPDEAIKVMKDYTEKTALICNKKPVFYVIAEEDKFKKAYERRDPILLVQSPFGFFWQILGAWDKEMLLLSEL